MVANSDTIKSMDNLDIASLNLVRKNGIRTIRKFFGVKIKVFEVVRYLAGSKANLSRAKTPKSYRSFHLQNK